MRAYATNSIGTSYGEVVVFYTKERVIVIERDSIIDSRDNKIYSTVKIGSQWWMAENLAYLPHVFLLDDQSSSEPRYYVMDYNGIEISKAKATSNFNKYGVLYNGLAVHSACPEGWDIAKNDDWYKLDDYVREEYGEMTSYDELGYILKSKTGWFGNGNGNDLVGFNAKPAGFLDGVGNRVNLGKSTNWWKTNLYNCYELRYEDKTLNSILYHPSWAASIRCVKN